MDELVQDGALVKSGGAGKVDSGSAKITDFTART